MVTCSPGTNVVVPIATTTTTVQKNQPSNHKAQSRLTRQGLPGLRIPPLSLSVGENPAAQQGIVGFAVRLWAIC